MNMVLFLTITFYVSFIVFTYSAFYLEEPLLCFVVNKYVCVQKSNYSC